MTIRTLPKPLVAAMLLALLAVACVAAPPQLPATSATGAAGNEATGAVTPTPTPSDIAGVVPWVDRPAPSFIDSTPSLPSANARPCGPKDLAAVAPDTVGAGLGNTNLPVVFVNVSASACTLLGYPTLTGVDSSGAHPIEANHGSYFGDPGPPANIEPGEKAMVNVSGADACPAVLDGKHLVYPTLRIGLPDGGSVDVAGSAFDAICGVWVSEFGVPAAAVPPSNPPLSPLTAAIEAPASVAAGSTLNYVVTLTNPTGATFSLTPCPAYEQYVGSGNATGAWVATIREGYLNCDAVTAIPAGGSVRFEMLLALPANQPVAAAKFGWHLQGDGGPWVNAPLEVVAGS